MQYIVSIEWWIDFVRVRVGVLCILEPFMFFFFYIWTVRGGARLRACPFSSTLYSPTCCTALISAVVASNRIVCKYWPLWNILFACYWIYYPLGTYYKGGFRRNSSFKHPWYYVEGFRRNPWFKQLWRSKAPSATHRIRKFHGIKGSYPLIYGHWHSQ